jgi:hypothetical protein
MHPKVTAVLRSKWTLPVACSAVSFGVGALAGFIFAKRQEKEIIDILVEDTVQLSFTFEEDTPWTNEQVKEYTEATGGKYVIAEEAYLTAEELEEEGDNESMVNVFVSRDEDWDYELEAFNRDPEKPYVIHRDEFFADEMGWDSQSTLTFYCKDSILCDERDEPLMNPDKIVGFLKFGHGSGDPNIVYIRNERLHAEYEVLQDPGSYEMDVLGGHVENQMERDDVRHSRSPGKFPRE